MSTATEVCCSTFARSGISSEWKKTVIFWLPTWQLCTQKPQNGNSLFLSKPKGRHIHKSTNNNNYLCQEYRKDKSVNFLPLLFHLRFQYLSDRIWVLRHSGDYFLGLRMNCSYFYKLSLISLYYYKLSLMLINVGHYKLCYGCAWSNTTKG